LREDAAVEGESVPMELRDVAERIRAVDSAEIVMVEA
jgi:hypothetical protein